MEPVPLRPKTWSVLRYLAERPGALVTKSELMNAVWSDVSVTESVMNKSIGELRAAFHDASKRPCFIETVQRRGFRFIARVSTELPATGHAPPTNDSSGLPPTDHRTPAGVPFVGRAKELRALNDLLAKAHDGSRQLAFVTGSAGIGKTALMDAFVEHTIRASAAPVWILRGGCVEQHGPREAYMPVLEALERLAHHPDADRLTRLLRRVAPTWLAQMSWLMPPGETDAVRQSLQVVTPQRMLREFAALMEAVATEVTVLLVLEDLHWSDPSTVDLLSVLGQRTDRARLLVVVTYRQADAIVAEHVLMSAARTLQMHHRCVEIPLDDLSEEAIAEYLHGRFPGNDFAPALARAIHGHTDGNPLFMVGVVDHMLSHGHLLETAPGWALREPLEDLELGVPDDVRLLIEEQFQGLSPADRALVQAASVAGNGFTPLVVAAALGADVADTEMRCETFARAHRFLRVAGRVEWPARTVTNRYAFTHELYRQVVYAEISEGQCVRLHQRIGHALEAAHGARRLEIAAQLAVHFERGRDDARALHYFGAAAARARERFASREAIGYLEPALALVALIPDHDERTRRELDLRLALGGALADIHGFAAEPVRRNYELASALCTKVGTPAQLFEVLYARWYLHVIRAERQEAIELASQLRDLARRLGSREARVFADSASMRTALYDGRYRDAADIMERRLGKRRQATEVTTPFTYGVAPLMAATSHHAIARWFLGDVDGAQATARTAVAQAQVSGHLFTIAAVLTQAAIVGVLCRDVAAVGHLSTEAIALSAEQGFRFWHALASLIGAWASAHHGAPAVGTAMIERALAAMSATGARYFSAFGYGFLAEAHLRAGVLPAALAAAEAGLVVANTTLDRAYGPELWRLKGEVLLAIERSRTARGRAHGRGTSIVDRDEPERCLLHDLELS
jgi:predicted ATPase/DNA-binding winged helix-turn-helix (wHTH) protein